MEQLTQARVIFRSLSSWAWRQPLQLFLVVTLIATAAYFYGFLGLFVPGSYSQGLVSVLTWAWQAWNPAANQEHSKLVPFIFLALVWLARDRLDRAPKAGSNLGLLVVAFALLLFLIGARCLQPRITLFSIPVLLYGSILYLWGKAVARILLFPCVFLLFLIPVAAIEQATFRLQFAITGMVGALSHLFGIKIHAVGTTLSAMDNSFDFEIAEGCSGIRSLTAIAMLTAIYVHLTQDRFWKKMLIFLSSIVFAVAGNVGRIFTVILVAKWIDPKLASGIYHDYSGYVFFPVALVAMLGFSKLVNLREDGSYDRAEQSRPACP